jgi:hypothetical protein
MPVHDWSRVPAGTFHDFHSSWITHIKECLNEGVLPESYYALSEQRAGLLNADVLTLDRESPAAPDLRETPPPGSAALAVADAPPRVALRESADPDRARQRRQRTVVIRHVSNHCVVALIEIVSPSNRDRAASVREFVEKAPPSPTLLQTIDR